MSTFSAKFFGSNVADLYLPYDNGMSQAIDTTVSTVRAQCPGVSSILDLGSGPGEPACTLAATFPSATVICSDVARAMVNLADERIATKGLRNVTTMVLDLSDLSAIPSASQDVVTANFAIISTPNLEECLHEVERVLKLGGFFVGTVWHSFSVPVLATDVMTQLVGEPPVPPSVDPMRLADVALLDALFANAGLRVEEGHNRLGEIAFQLGTVSGTEAWKSLMISHLAKLEAMEQAGDAGICERAKEAVESLAAAKGFLRDGGELTVPGTYRIFCVKKPHLACLSVPRED